MDNFYNYKGAIIIGFCLNVMGLKVGERSGYGKDSYALRRVVINWVKKNYLTLHKELPDVADACLIGAITFDEKKRRITKTFAGRLQKKPSRQHLKLDERRKPRLEGS